jgi:hypothetical protein
MPFKTLHYGPVTPEIKPLLYRRPTMKADSEMREYVFMYDTAQLSFSSEDKQNLIAYMKERSDYIFDKQIKDIDRLSISKFSSNIELDILCKLTFKSKN